MKIITMFQSEIQLVVFKLLKPYVMFIPPLLGSDTSREKYEEILCTLFGIGIPYKFLSLRYDEMNLTMEAANLQTNISIFQEKCEKEYARISAKLIREYYDKRNAIFNNSPDDLLKVHEAYYNQLEEKGKIKKQIAASDKLERLDKNLQKANLPTTLYVMSYRKNTCPRIKRCQRKTRTSFSRKCNDIGVYAMALAISRQNRTLCLITTLKQWNEFYQEQVSKLAMKESNFEYVDDTEYLKILFEKND